MECKACRSDYGKAHYAANKDRYKRIIRLRQHERVARNRAKLFEVLKDSRCADCGEADPVVLEFDHVRGTKLDAVSQMVARGSGWGTISTEISKCEVVCANCHRRRTYRREGSWRSSFSA